MVIETSNFFSITGYFRVSKQKNNVNITKAVELEIEQLLVVIDALC